MSSRKLLFLLLLLLGGALGAQPLAFGLLGDTPYNAWERQQLPVLLADMGREDLAFAVHAGDIKSGSSECSDALLLDRLALFQASPLPLVYVPGDNEWTDCHRRSNGAYDPLERLERLRELFFSGDGALGQRALRLERQSSDPAFARYRENTRWEAAGVLFVGLNLPGSENNYHGAGGGSAPVPEFVARAAANRAWLAQAFARAREHALAGVLLVVQGNPGFEAFSAGKARPGYRDFLLQLQAETQAFGGQVVLVHGDSHQQRVDQPLLEASGRALLDNFTRVETFGYPFFGWIKATVDRGDPRVFRFSPRPWQTSMPPR